MDLAEVSILIQRTPVGRKGERKRHKARGGGKRRKRGYVRERIRNSGYGPCLVLTALGDEFSAYGFRNACVRNAESVGFRACVGLRLRGLAAESES